MMCKTQIELDSLITEVKDVLCDLGTGFIERCLQHYNYDSSAAINSVLEDSLPESLKTLDRMLPYIPPDPMVCSRFYLNFSFKYANDNIIERNNLCMLQM